MDMIDYISCRFLLGNSTDLAVAAVLGERGGVLGLAVLSSLFAAGRAQRRTGHTLNGPVSAGAKPILAKKHFTQFLNCGG